jgi:conjugal transfer ATP-binding protein TraC
MKDYLKEILDQSSNPSPKSEILPYRYYDKENDLFVNNSSNIGFVLELNPIVGVSSTIIEQLSLLFDEYLPEAGYLQVMMVTTSDISFITGPWLKQYENASELLKTSAQDRVDHLNKLTKEGGSSYRIKEYKILVTYSKIADYNKQIIHELNNFRMLLEALFRSCNISFRRAPIDYFLNLVSDIISPGSVCNKYNEFNAINEQIAPSSPMLVSHNKLKLGSDYMAKSYIFEQTPNEFSIESMINLLGDSNQDNLQIPGKLILSYIISNDIKDRKQALMRDKGANLFKSADSYLMKSDNYAKREISQWQIADKLLNSGKKLLSTSFTITLIDKSEDFSRTEGYLTSVYITNGFKLKPLDYFMLPGFLSSLPFGPGAGLFSLFKNYGLAKTTTSTEPLGFLPIHAEWKGNSNKGILLVGRRGQPFTVDLFTGESNNNANIIGESGSGKSVTIQEFVTNFIASDAKVIILDIGRSYEKICNAYQGNFVEFKINSNICLNPFDKFKPNSPEELSDFLSLMLPILAKMAAPKRGTTDIEDSILASILHDVWHKFGNNTTISRIADRLNAENNEVATNLSKMLFQYSDKGNYGRFFNGQSNVDFKNRMTVFEFEELRERRDLLAVIMQMISAQFMTQIFSGDREKRTVIIFDEAWFALDLFPEFLAGISRTIRKYNGSLILGTQSVNDYYINDTAKSILENSGWLFMLKQKPSSVDLLLDSKRASLDGPQVQLIKSLKTIPGKYSECLISSSMGYVIGRLILDPYKQILYSTTPAQFNQVQKLIKTGMSINDAVKTIAKEVAYA